MDERLPAAWRGFPVLAVALAATLPYLGVLRAPYVFDDIKLVKENKFLHASWEDPRTLFETFDVTSRRWDEEALRRNYRPLRFVSYTLDYGLSRLWFGEFPAGDPPVLFFHLSNVLLHALNAVLVLFIARALALDLLRPGPARPREAAFLGLAAGLIFALHPLATEAVTYISGRRDVLSTFFFLAALAIYLRARADESPRPVEVLAAPLLFALGLLAKEMVVTLPAAILLVDLLRRARPGWSRVMTHALLWMAALGAAAITLSNRSLIAGAPAEGKVNVVLTACRYTARYLGLALAPIRQSVDYSFDAIPASAGPFQPWTALPCLFLVLALLGLALRWLLDVARGRQPAEARAWLALGSLWFLGTLVPVLHIVPIPERFAERFAYLPLAGAALAAAAGLTFLRRAEPAVGWALAMIIAAAGMAGTVRRNDDWKSPLELWTAAVRAQPRAARAHLGRANALKEAGRLREAGEEYTRAIEIFEEKPGVPLHHGFLLQALTFRCEVNGLLAAEDAALLDRAIGDYRRVLSMQDVDGVAIESSPRHTALHFNLASVLLQKGERGEAAAEYRRVLELGQPAALVGGSHYYLGKIALLGGDPRAAAADFERAYETIPRGDPAQFTVAVELADLLVDQKDLDGALRVVARALEHGASGKMRLHLRMREAKALDRRGDLSGCVAVLEAILAEDAAYPPALITLAGIELNQGRADRAEARYRAVLEKDATNPEALEGLERARLLQRIATGPAPGEPDATPILEAMERKAAEAHEGGKLLAARDLYRSLLERATAAKKRPFQVRALGGLAGVEDMLGHHRKAGEHLEAALELEPRDLQVLRQCGDLQLRRFGEKEAARRYYERYLEALPRDRPADPLVHFNLAAIIDRTDPNLALGHLRLAKDGGYDPPALDRRLGYLQAGAGRWADSLDAFNRYLERASEDAGEEAEREKARRFVKEEILPHLAPGER